MVRLMEFTRARPYTVNTLHVSILLKQVRHNNIRISYIYYKFPFTRPQNTARSKNGSEGNSLQAGPGRVTLRARVRNVPIMVPGSRNSPRRSPSRLSLDSD